MIDIKKFVNLLIKLKISPNQFLWTYLNMVKDYATLYKYIKNNGFPDTSEVDDLIDRGIVIDMGGKGELYADQLLVADSFSKYFLTMDVKQANEFWKLYPDSIVVNGRPYKTKSLNKENLLMEYQQSVSYNEETHKKALECLKNDISKGLINSKIDKYISGKPWEDYEESVIKPKGNII